MTSNVILFEDRCACQAKLPRGFDVFTSRVALIGDSTVGKTCLVGRWVKGQSMLHNVVETGDDHVEDLYHKIIEHDALKKSSSYSGYQELLKQNTQGVEVELDSEIPAGPERDAQGNLVSGYQSVVYSSVQKQDKSYDANRKLDVQVIDVTHFDVTDYSDIRTLQVDQADGFILCYDTTNPATLADLAMYHRLITRVKGDDVPTIVCGTKIDNLQERKVSLDEAKAVCEEMGIPFETRHFETSAVENTNVDATFYSILRLIENQKLERTTSAAVPNCCQSGNCCAKQHAESQPAPVLPPVSAAATKSSHVVSRVVEKPSTTSVHESTHSIPAKKRSQTCCIIC